jgi:regulatory protein
MRAATSDPAGRVSVGGVVTALTPDARLAGAIRVEIDGSPFATVAAETVAAAGLVVGHSVNEPARALLEEAADVEAAYRTAVRSLERRSFARADLARRLQRKGHPRPAVDAALERLGRQRLLDDADFALNYAETRAARGRGPSRITRDLLAMGVERRLIDRALTASAAEGEDNGAVPLALATRRAAQLGDLPRPVKRRRLLAFLARRGYAGREIGDMVKQVVG